MSEDLIDRIAGAPAAVLRDSRPEVKAALAANAAVLFGDTPPAALTAAERHAIGLRAAVLAEAPGLAAHHRAGLTLAGTDEALVNAVAAREEEVLDARLGALLAWTDLLTLNPAAGTPEAIRPLRDAGLSSAEIVTAAQIVAHASFQARLLAGLGLLAKE